MQLSLFCPFYAIRTLHRKEATALQTIQFRFRISLILKRRGFLFGASKQALFCQASSLQSTVNEIIVGRIQCTMMQS
jgi:hypothetical protein